MSDADNHRADQLQSSMSLLSERLNYLDKELQRSWDARGRLGEEAGGLYSEIDRLNRSNKSLLKAVNICLEYFDKFEGAPGTPERAMARRCRSAINRSLKRA